MTWVSTTDDPRQWSTTGFIELVTPVRPPTSSDGSAHIVVFLRIPSEGVLTASRHTPLSLEVPTGSVAVRVEYAGTRDAPDASVDPTWRILDVRQFDWLPDGMACTVLRPDGQRQLVGLRWRCGEREDRRAGELLALYMRAGRFFAPRSEEGRARSAHRIQRVNDCRACHQFERVEDRSVAALVQRGTDASGLFSLSSVFRDEDPVERYRPIDTNADDLTMHPVCPGSEIDVVAARCRDGLRPRLHVDVARGRQIRSAHVLRLCESRRQIASRLDAPALAAVAPALAACAP